MKKKYLLAILPLLILSCQPDQDYLDLESFYFPYHTLEEGLVYEYHPSNADSTGVEYWFYKSVRDQTGWHLTGNFYDQQLNVRQFYRENIFETGSLVADYFIYAYDSLGQSSRIDAKIEAANAFPFRLKDSTSVLVSNMSWTFSENPKQSTTITRNRQYSGRVQYKFKGETYEAIKFDTRELVDDDNEGHLETEYTGLEIYAKGLGLVYYHKEIGDQLDLQYQLVDIYPMSNLEAQFNKSNEVIQ